jgi:hypothetical protein
MRSNRKGRASRVHNRSNRICDPQDERSRPIVVAFRPGFCFASLQHLFLRTLDTARIMVFDQNRLAALPVWQLNFYLPIRASMTTLVKVRSKETEAVVRALSRHVRKFPVTLRHSLTWDRGLEMARHKEFTVATKVKVYFCDPQSPWRRGILGTLVSLQIQTSNGTLTILGTEVPGEFVNGTYTVAGGSCDQTGTVALALTGQWDYH